MAKQTKPKVNKREALEMRLQGKTYQEIGDHYQVTKAAIHQQLKPLLTGKIDVEEYKKNKAGHIHSVAAMTLSAMTNAKAEESTLAQLGATYAKLNEQAALEEGRATSITETRVAVVLADASRYFK